MKLSRSDLIYDCQ